MVEKKRGGQSVIQTLTAKNPSSVGLAGATEIEFEKYPFADALGFRADVEGWTWSAVAFC